MVLKGLLECANYQFTPCTCIQFLSACCQHFFSLSLSNLSPKRGKGEKEIRTHTASLIFREGDSVKELLDTFPLNRQ